jgi:hypothetical protein
MSTTTTPNNNMNNNTVNDGNNGRREEEEEEYQIPDDIGFYVISVSYGGYSVSQECTDEINRRRQERGVTERYHDCGSCDEFTDPDLLDLLDEMGSDWCSGRCARLIKVPIIKSLLKYVRVHDYDGQERLDIDFAKAFSDGVRDVLNRDGATIDDVRAWSDKIESSKKMLAEYYRINCPPSRSLYL